MFQMDKKILKYDESQMLAAITAVKAGWTTAKASKHYKVPRTTLLYKLSGKYPISRKMGPPSYLTKEHEAILSKWIITSQKAGFPVSKIYV